MIVTNSLMSASVICLPTKYLLFDSNASACQKNSMSLSYRLNKMKILDPGKIIKNMLRDLTYSHTRNYNYEQKRKLLQRSLSLQNYCED